jgi:voltage-gated potassium channel
MGRFDSVGVRLAVATSLPFVLVALGTLGYQWIEGWSWFDALYMTVITLGTVGFGETHELSQPGRAFTIVLILGGAFTMAAAVTSVIRALISGDLRQLLGRQRMERTLAHFENHVIVVGFGRMGKLVCEEFTQASQPFVIIDRNSDALRSFDSKIGVALPGDGTTDERSSMRTSIARARSSRCCPMTQTTCSSR